VELYISHSSAVGINPHKARNTVIQIMKEEKNFIKIKPPYYREYTHNTESLFKKN
jgi:hypothetical protein